MNELIKFSAKIPILRGGLFDSRCRCKKKQAVAARRFLVPGGIDHFGALASLLLP